MNTYHALYRGKQIELKSDSAYHAQQTAARQFGAKKNYEVCVALVAVGSREITHVAVD